MKTHNDKCKGLKRIKISKLTANICENHQYSEFDLIRVFLKVTKCGAIFSPKWC